MTDIKSDSLIMPTNKIAIATNCQMNLVKQGILDGTELFRCLICALGPCKYGLDTPNKIEEEEWDKFILPSSICDIPLRSDNEEWLQISQVTITNVRGLINRGKSETAEKVMEHYWKRWRNA